MATLAAVAGTMVVAAPASAHPSPDGCRANGLDLTLAKTAQVLRQGDTITFLVGVQNTNSLLGLPCDITGASVGIHLPQANGQYDANSPTATVVSNQTFASGFAFKQIGAFDWVVKLNPGVTYAYALARVSGTLHDTDPDRTFANIVKDIGFTVTNPSLTIDKTGSIVTGQAPANVTYTYVVTNTSQTTVPMDRVAVSDDLCANPTYASGDNGDGVLSNGESWTYTCSTLHQTAGTYVNTARACAYSRVPDDTKRPVCSPPDTWTVVLDAPPPPVLNSPPPTAPDTPVSSVRPQSVNQAPCDVAPPSGITVRAGQLNTIKVRTRSIDAGTKVTITLPGGKKVTAKTDKNGVATLRVRPTRTGKASIRAAKCSDVARVSIRPARRTVASKAPRVTG
ncbi:MAG TPA: hypothetical protein VNS09_11730 [Solirubrobacter sp.]|nr:hypothetical protein [Solirubrobacter sp.]